MSTMKAVRFHEYGGPEVLRYEETDAPEPGDAELRVRIHAAGVNPVDLAIEGGKFGKGTLPKTAGFDFSGRVDRVGRLVRAFAVNDEVFGRPSFGKEGAYAEYVVVSLTDIAAKPRSIDHAHAAGIPTAGLAAWQSLFESGGKPTIVLEKGMTILIHGAAGGVGSFAVQLAKWKGAKVIATAHTDNLGYVRELGADVVVDYTKERFEDVAKDVDAVLDLVGGETQQRSWSVLKRGGVLASTVGNPPEEEAQKHGVRAVGVMAGQDSRVLSELSQLVDQKGLQVMVEEVLPLAKAREAQEKLKSSHVRGKLVLEV